MASSVRRALLAPSVRRENASLYFNNQEWMKWKDRREFEAAAGQSTNDCNDIWYRLTEFDNYCRIDLAAFAYRKGEQRCADLTCHSHHFQAGNGIGEVRDSTTGEMRTVYFPPDDAVMVVMAFREDRKVRFGACVDRMTTGTCKVKKCPKAHTGFDTQLNRWREEYGINGPQHSRGQPVCRHWEKDGECWFGNNCNFAHPDKKTTTTPALPPIKPAPKKASEQGKGESRDNPFDALRDLDAAE